MQEVDCFEHLVGQLLEFLIWYPLWGITLQFFEHSPLNVFKDQKQLFLLPKDLQQSDNIIIFEVLKDSNLSQDSFPNLY